MLIVMSRKATREQMDRVMEALRARGFKPVTLGAFIRPITRQSQLVRQYPAAG